MVGVSEWGNNQFENIVSLFVDALLDRSQEFLLLMPVFAHKALLVIFSDHLINTNRKK